MNDTALPPGCAPLTFDPNDRTTWGNKRVHWPSAPPHDISARIVWVDADKDQCLFLWKNTFGSYETAWADRQGFYVGTRDWLRLYDAAPEPVKPREWWGIVDVHSRTYDRMVAYTDRAIAENAMIGLGVLNREPLARLREVPLDDSAPSPEPAAPPADGTALYVAVSPQPDHAGCYSAGFARHSLARTREVWAKANLYHLVRLTADEVEAIIAREKAEDDNPGGGR